MEFNIELSNIAIYTIILLAIGLFFLFRLLSWLLPPLLLKKERRRFVYKYTSIVELFVWITFLIWSVYFLSEKSPLYAAGLFLILLTFTFWTAWIGLKDYIAGAIFKTSNNLNINEIIQIGEYHGKIIKYTHTTLVIETEAGEIIYLPYSYIKGKVIIKSHPAESILSNTFRFEIHRQASIQGLIDKIYIDIINLPWSSLKRDPIIKPVAETTLGHLLEITVFSNEKEFFPEMENLIKAKYGTTVIADDNSA